jgi:hypothetical protein
MNQNQGTIRASQTLSPINLSENDQATLSDILGDVWMNLTLLYFVAFVAELSTIYS